MAITRKLGVSKTPSMSLFFDSVNVNGPNILSLEYRRSLLFAVRDGRQPLWHSVEFSPAQLQHHRMIHVTGPSLECRGVFKWTPF